MSTLVTAFLMNVNDFTVKEKYIRNGILLLRTNINKVVYIDQETYECIKEYENEQTKLVITKIEDLFLYEYRDKITKFKVNSKNPPKDTINFMLTMCNKTEWVSDAIKKNYFPTSSNYIWVDFGIRYICKRSSDDEFIEKISGLCDKKYIDCVRIGNVWNLNKRYCNNIYQDIIWYFAGGVFGGDPGKLVEFADYMRHKCTEIIETKQTIMWEVNIWYMIYLEHPDLFNAYKCDHNESLLDGY